MLRKALEELRLFGGQRTKRAAGHIAQANWAEADSLQTHDLVVNSREQTANFAVLSFVEHDVEISAVAHRLLHADPFDRESTFVEVHTAFQRCERVWRGDTFDVAEVKLRDAIAWVSHSVGQFAIIGHEDQALAFGVETTDRKHSFFEEFREHVDDSRTSLRIVV